MPVYAYACKDCGHAFDIRQSFSDDALTVCPECGGRLRKKFNSVGVVFKGSGFYRTDSRSDSSSSEGSSGTSGSGDSAKTPAADKGASKDSGNAASATSGSGASSSSASATSGSTSAS